MMNLKNLLFLLTALWIYTVGLGQDINTINGPFVSKAYYFDTTPPLREMPIVLPGERDRSWKDNIIQNRSMEEVYRNMEADIPEGFVDPVLQTNYPATREIAGPELNFDGVGNVNGVVPPDTDGDVGPNHYFQMINLSYAIWDKQGNLLYGPVDNSTLWNGFIGPWTGTNDGDPIVLYDELADRWMASQFAVNTGNGTYWQLIAVSTSPDPLGSYHRYAFQMPAFNDYPKLSVWPDGYYATFNMFGSYVRVGVAAYEREKMLAGNENAQMVYFDQPNGTFSMQPADFDGTAPPAGTPCYFGHIRFFSTQKFEIYEFDVDWTTPGNSTFSLVNTLSPASFNPNLNGVTQPGTSQKLDDLSQMLMFRLQYRNFGSYQTLVANHTVNAGSGIAGIRWYELRKTTTNWSIHQQGTYAPSDGLNRWMGSIAMNGNGDIALGFSVSSSSVYPSIRYVGRRSYADPGEMNLDEISVLSGTSSQTGINRFGDYSCLSVDPADDSTFWFTTEYISGGWRTRIVSFDLGPIEAPVVDAGNDTLICENGSFVANAVASNYQLVQWHSAGDGYFLDDNVLDAIYIRGPQDIDTGLVDLWVVVTGYQEGLEDTDSVHVDLSKSAWANAGPDTTICADDPVTLSGTAMYQDSTRWKSDGDGTFDDIYIPDATYTPGPEDIEKGYVWLRFTAYDSLPCSNSITDKVKITIDECTGIQENENGGFVLIVAPNPAHEQLSFRLSGIGPETDVQLSLLDNKGYPVFSMTIPEGRGEYSNSMNVSRFTKGIYYLKAVSGQEQVIRKIILN